MEPILFDITFPLSQTEFSLTRCPTFQMPEWTVPQETLFGADIYRGEVKPEFSDYSDSDVDEFAFNNPSPPPPPPPTVRERSSIDILPMELFPADKVSDFKHVIYNLLVENYNLPNKTEVPFLEACAVQFEGQIRHGFRFNENAREHPDKKLPELYAYHIRKGRLDLEDQNSIFIQDLYKFYQRACLELLGKYFQKIDKYTFLYDDETPLFVPGTSLKQAEERMKKMRTRARKRKSSEEMKIKSKRIMPASLKFE